MEGSTKSPEEWLHFITKERKTYRGPNKYKYWMQLYRRAVDSIPADEFAHNNNAYAKIMVDFAKLQARTSEDDARNIFQAARSNVKHCSLVYVAWAQFELLKGNPKKCKKLLEKGKQFCAEPGYLLDMALQNLKSGNEELIDEETEEHTFTELINGNVSKTEDFTYHAVESRPRTSDSSIESSSSSVGVFSPERAHFSNESSEESDIADVRKYSRSTNLSSIEESHSFLEQCGSLNIDENVKAATRSAKMSSGAVTGQPNSTDPNSSCSNDHSKIKKLGSLTYVMPMKSVGEHAICGSSNDTTESSSSNYATPLLPTNSVEGEIQVPSLKSSVANNITEKECSEASNFSIPVAPSTRNKGRLSGSSESGDDIDAFSLKKSLLNLGYKTGLMAFATPQDQKSGQVIAGTGTDSEVVGSLIKGRRTNKRAKRSVFIGLPQRINKSTKDESGENEVRQESASYLDSEKIEGVYAFPQDNHFNDSHSANSNSFQPLNPLKDNQIQSMSTSISASNILANEMLTQVPVKKEHVSKDTEHVQMNKNSNFPSGHSRVSNENKLSYDKITNKQDNELDNVPKKYSVSSNEVIVTQSFDGLRGSQNDHDTRSISLSNAAHDQHILPHLNDRADHSTTQRCSNSAQTVCTVRSDLEQNTSLSSNAVDPLKRTPVPLTTTCSSSQSANSGYLQLNNSMSASHSGMQNMSRIIGQYSDSSRKVTVNGKVYSKLNRIGRGGSSEVYTVFDADYAQYALKYVDVKDAEDSIFQNYVNEITLLKRLQGHESIIKLYDWEMDGYNKIIKIVLERGSIDLAGYLKKNPKKITIDFIKMCWRKMLDAVDVIHKEGIIHSDLKPSNFLLVEWNLKLIDFGIANAIQGDVTSFYRDSTIGTLSYMSPEALKDVSKSNDPDEQHKPLIKIGRPSDVWSLGCILYLMVYGKTPFQHIKNNFKKWSCIIDPSYEIKFPDIENKDLLDSIKGCLRRNPSERFTIPMLQGHPFLTGRTSANDVDNVVNCIMQMQDVSSPRALRTFAQNLVGHLSSGGSLNMTSIHQCQNSQGKSKPQMGS